MSNAAHVQRKLMDYFVQNPDDFNDKFQVEEVPCANLDGIICTDEASQYIKFSMDLTQSKQQKLAQVNASNASKIL